MYYDPKKTIVPYLLVKGKLDRTEFIRMRNGYIFDSLTSVDVQEIFKIGRKTTKLSESVVFGENFKIIFFQMTREKSFNLRTKNKDENNEVMQLLVKVLRNSFIGERLRRDINEEYACK